MKCVFCNALPENKNLVSLDGIHFLCKDCLLICLEELARQGEIIDLHLSAISPQIANTLGKFLDGKLKFNQVVMDSKNIQVDSESIKLDGLNNMNANNIYIKSNDFKIMADNTNINASGISMDNVNMEAK